MPFDCTECHLLGAHSNIGTHRWQILLPDGRDLIFSGRKTSTGLLTLNSVLPIFLFLKSETCNAVADFFTCFNFSFVCEGALHKTLRREPVQVLNSAMCLAAELTTNALYYSKILEFIKESRFLHFADATEILIFKNVIQRLNLLQTFPEVQLQDFFRIQLETIEPRSKLWWGNVS